MNDKINIAIVDDHALFRKSLAMLIDMFPGYRVSMDAANGKDLIGQLKPGELPQIVLMDISMPVMDGYATTAWLRENHPEVKVIALSTMHAETAIIKMIKSGAKGYILKDAEPADLRLAFEEVLDRGYFYNDLVTRKIIHAVMDLNGTEKNQTSTFAKLSTRELDFLKYACTELTYKEIADKLFVSSRTVEGYRDSLCEKLGLKSRVGLAMYALKNNLVSI